MKRVLGLLSLSALLVVSVSCKDKAASKIEAANVEVAANRDDAQTKLPVIAFEKMEHDFGTIENGTPQETTFTFTNNGEAPLIITDTKTSCGCTTPKFPKDKPIAPGETGEIAVRFNGTGNGQVAKTITVMANTAKGSEILRIKAFVNPKGAAPAGPVKS